MNLVPIRLCALQKQCKAAGWFLHNLSYFILTRQFPYSFEKTLKAKLSQKATGLASEESVLLKAFKYFDLNNNGTVEPEEFAKAVEKIGIMIPTKQVSTIHTRQSKVKRSLPGQRPLNLIFICNNLGLGQSFQTLR